MQTFLPYPDFAQTARCLDRARLGKQRVEVVQILRALDFGGGWSRHPATLMWSSHASCLAQYGIAICGEWIRRGYRDSCLYLIREYVTSDPATPAWLGDPKFHDSHKSNLLRKDPMHYSQFGWNVPNNLAYVWPGECKLLKGTLS